MKQIKKIIILSFAFTLLISVPANAAEIRPYAWPGRPGGTGTGAEEWLQGEYGEMNGPYILIYSSSGKTSDITGSSNSSIIASFIFDSILTRYFPAVGLPLSITDVGNAIRSNRYEGAYYTLEAYISGRRVKVSVTTYHDKNYTDFANSFDEILKF